MDEDCGIPVVFLSKSTVVGNVSCLKCIVCQSHVVSSLLMSCLVTVTWNTAPDVWNCPSSGQVSFYMVLAGVPGVARVNKVRKLCNLIPPRHYMCL